MSDTVWKERLTTLMEVVDRLGTGYTPDKVRDSILESGYGLSGVDRHSDPWNPSRISLTDEEHLGNMRAMTAAILEQYGEERLPAELRDAIRTAMDGAPEEAPFEGAEP